MTGIAFRLPIFELRVSPELNTQFVDKVVAQQKAYAKQIADVFTPAAV